MEKNRIDSIFDVKAINEETAQVSKMLYGIIDLQKQISGNGKKMAADCCTGASPARIPLVEVLPHFVITEMHEKGGALTSCWSHLEGAGIFQSTKAGDIVEDLCYFLAKNARVIVQYQDEKNRKA